jgi:hypothetical protein
MADAAAGCCWIHYLPAVVYGEPDDTMDATALLLPDEQQ